jgi:hypothetical protein
MSQERVTSSREASKVSVIVVVLAAIAIGLIVDLTQGARSGAIPPPFGSAQAGFDTPGGYHVILSTLGIVLLFALVVVYGRTYGRTHGIFPLGLIVVFSSLLLQESVSSPLFAQLFENTPLTASFPVLVADTFRDVAYIVFLYISLE